MTASSRKRRHREREKAGLIVLKIEIHEAAFSSALIDSGRLDEVMVLDRSKLNRVASEIISEWSENIRSRVPRKDPSPNIKRASGHELISKRNPNDFDRG